MRSNTVCVAVYQLPHCLSSKEQIRGHCFWELSFTWPNAQVFPFLMVQLRNQLELHSTLLHSSFVWLLTGEMSSCPLGIPQLSWQQGSCFPPRGQWERGHTAPWSWKWRHATSAIFLSSSNSGANWEECTVHGGQRRDSSGVTLQTATGTQIKSLRTKGVQNIHCALEFSKYFHKKRSFQR